MKSLTKIFLTVSVITLTASSAFAASDGSIGASSTGTSSLTLTIPKLIKVSGMNDIAFGSWSPGTAKDSNFDLVVAGNDDSSPTYKANLTGSGAGGAFELDRSGTAIAYTVCYNDATGVTGCTSATAGTDITGQTGIHTSLNTATDNANIRVQISDAAMQAAPEGAYSGTLTLVVTPE